MSVKKPIWDIILKAIIAAASAILGALSADAMNL
ncbi:smalltalk protein [Bacteroides sp.]|nr:smalltalk protein [Bacteroides sp.]MDD3039392.1 smalltalk protein [Bacteroides sp.]